MWIQYGTLFGKIPGRGEGSPPRGRAAAESAGGTYVGVRAPQPALGSTNATDMAVSGVVRGIARGQRTRDQNAKGLATVGLTL